MRDILLQTDLLVVGLAGLCQLCKDFQRERKLSLRCDRRITRETLPNETSGEIHQVGLGLGEQELRQLLVLLIDRNQSTAQQSHYDSLRSRYGTTYSLGFTLA